METLTLLASTTQRALLADLEGLWQCFDELVGTLGPDDWSGKHGQHWTFTDVPYHLAYFDLEVIAAAIERGLSVPASEQVLRTEAEQDAWNEIRFTQRPADCTPQQCLEQMEASRQAIRAAVAGLSEAELERPVFIPLVGLGWVSVRVALETCYSHTWNHLMQLRFWMQRQAPTPSPAQTQRERSSTPRQARLLRQDVEPSPAQTHRALSYFMTSFAQNMDRQLAAQASLTTVMEFSGPGVGIWTLHVADGICRVSERRATQAELVIVQSPETFVRTRTGIEHPRLARWRGKIKVSDRGKLGTFEKLFPIKSLDFAPAPVKVLNVRTVSGNELLIEKKVA